MRWLTAFTIQAPQDVLERALAGTTRPSVPIRADYEGKLPEPLSWLVWARDLKW